MKYQRRRRADLSGRMLRGEDLREVDWRDAKLVGADLSGALLVERCRCCTVPICT